MKLVTLLSLSGLAACDLVPSMTSRSPRDSYLDRLRARHPQADFPPEEDVPCQGDCAPNEDLQTLPVLSAVVAPVEPNMVSITLHNANDQNVIVLPWYSFLPPASASRALRLSDGAGNLVGPSPDLPTSVTFQGPPLREDFATIAAGQDSVTNVDLTSIFDVTVAGTYSLELAPIMFGDFDPGDVRIFNGTTYSRSVVNVTSTATLVDLTPPTARRVLAAAEGDNIQDCSPEDRELVLRMVKGAQDMGARARLSGENYDYFREKYFGTLAHDARLQSVLDNIANYRIDDPANPTGLTWHCNRGDDVSVVNGYCAELGHPYAFQWGNEIVFCDKWFGLAENNPWVPSYLLWAENDSDKPTVAFHEMTHTFQLGGQPHITDVPDQDWFSKYFLAAYYWAGDCYTYSCTVGLADGGWDGYTALDNAQNYAYYAKNTRDCYPFDTLCS